MISHFGRNPVSGGKPPKDRSAAEIINSVAGFLLHVSDIRLIVVIENCIKIINIAVVRKA